MSDYPKSLGGCYLLNTVLLAGMCYMLNQAMTVKGFDRFPENLSTQGVARLRPILWRAP